MVKVGSILAILMVVFVALASVAADAQGPQLDRARRLLETGNAAAALDILETLPQTTDVLQGRAQAHFMIASQSQSVGRCSHLRRAMAYASMASTGELVELGRKNWRDEGCQPTQ